MKQIIKYSFFVLCCLATQNGKAKSVSDLTQANDETGDYPGLTITEGQLNLSSKGLTDLDGLSGVDNIDTVTDLRLNGNALTAIGADEFNNEGNALFPNLEKLYLQEQTDDSLTSIHRQAFSNLTNLKRLYFYDNTNLTGAVPSFAGLSGLTHLDFEDCNFASFSDSDPFADQDEKLELLYFYDNTNLTGAVPSFAGLSGLTHLEFDDCNFTSFSDANPFVDQNERLESLNFHKNTNLTGAVPSFTGLSGLTDLRFYDCNFTSFSDANPFADQNEKLERLNFYDNTNLTGAVPSFAGLSGLNDLEFDDCNFTSFSDANPFADQDDNLTTLHFHKNTNLTGAVPSFTGLSGLEDLRFYDCNFTSFRNTTGLSGGTDLSFKVGTIGGISHTETTTRTAFQALYEAGGTIFDNNLIDIEAVKTGFVFSLGSTAPRTVEEHHAMCKHLGYKTGLY